MNQIEMVQKEIADKVNYHNLGEEAPIEIEPLNHSPFCKIKNFSLTIFSLTMLNKNTGLSIFLRENEVLVG